MRFTSQGRRRWGALVGLALAISALFSGYSLSWEYPSESSPTMSASEIARFIAANRGGLGLNLFLEGLTAILLVVFAGLIRNLIATTRGSDGLIERLFFAAAVLAAAVDLSVGLTTGIALVQFASSSATTSLATLWMLNFADMIVIGFPLAFMLGTATVMIWRTRVVARWIAVVSGLAAVLELIAAIASMNPQAGLQLPFWLVAWALVVSGGLVVERHRTPAPGVDPNPKPATAL